MIPSLPDQVRAIAAAARAQRATAYIERMRGHVLPEGDRTTRLRCTALRLLSTGGELTIRQLTDAAPEATKSSWTHILTSLVDAGWADKLPRKQRKGIPVGVGEPNRYRITESGRAMLATLESLASGAH